MTDAAESGRFRIGGAFHVNRLGFGAMRIVGRGIWGPPPDRWGPPIDPLSLDPHTRPVKPAAGARPGYARPHPQPDARQFPVRLGMLSSPLGTR